MKPASILKLVRLSALPSAWADVFGGMALAVALAGRANTGKLPWLLLASTGVYLGGMACNDVLHARKDRLLGKRRPIPSGEVSWQAAWAVMAALFVLGLVGGVVAGVGGWVALLIALVFLYNWLAIGHIEAEKVHQPFARAVAGVAVIALCRALHVSLPLLAHGKLGLILGQEIWRLFAACVLLYFCCVTVVSLFEDTGGGRASLRGVAYAMYLPVLGFPLYLISLAQRLPNPSATNPLAGPVFFFCALMVLTLMLTALQGMLDVARREPTPPNLGRAVGAGIRSECLLMCGFAWLLAPAQPWWGFGALALYPVGAVLSKWISPT